MCIIDDLPLTNSPMRCSVVSRGMLTERKIYSNDAMFDQLPYQTYPGSNYARLKAIQRKYDLNGFFATRTGGFKYN